MASIDYSPPGSTVNRDPATGIRYGVIPLARLGESAHESFESHFHAACPHCGADVPADTHFTAEHRPAHRLGLWTVCTNEDGARAYCPGPEWFDGSAPFPIYSVKTGERVDPADTTGR